MDVYLELGTKRVFAGALDWPGLCRTARDQDGAMTALLAYGPRYADVLAAGVRPRFAAPKRLSDLVVAERLEGNATTDFGAPSIAPAADALSVKPADRRKLCSVLEACWAALDRAASGAAGVELARGPRGQRDICGPGGSRHDGIHAGTIPERSSISHAWSRTCHAARRTKYRGDHMAPPRGPDRGTPAVAACVSPARTSPRCAAGDCEPAVGDARRRPIFPA